jgi:ActR/RegA family two-component response regulator
MTKSVLLIEDDAFKARRLEAVVRGINQPLELRIAHSVTSGLTALVDHAPDALLLDMSLSTYDVGARETGGRPQNFGGLAVLEHMQRRAISCPVLVITQFGAFEREAREVSLSELEQELQTKFPLLFHGIIFYDSREKSWEPRLLEGLNAMLGGEQTP